jgi:hypothetical protein
MNETKTFPIADVLSAVTGCIMREPDGIGGVYEVLNWMTGESLFTHQLPRVSKEAQAFFVKAYPEWAQTVGEAKNVNGQTCREWLVKWTSRHGQTFDVPKFDADGHERIDALSEAAEYFPPDRTIVVTK